jgi:FAD/FMN-containing dehydrogenase
LGVSREGRVCYHTRPCRLTPEIGIFVTSLTPQIAREIAAIVGTDQLLQDSDSALRYGRDWTRVQQPRPCAVVLPNTVEEVQALVKLAGREQLALVPSGGRTGLSGGAVAASGELVIALDRLNRIEEFNPVDRRLRCGAGVITGQLQEFAAEQGLFYPVDFASSGSSQIGGNVATNAGGIKVIRYGMTRDWIIGLKVVTGSGELLDLNRGLMKNNAGYDLRHLFIGSEGTLGIVVEVTVRLERPPRDPAVLVLGVTDMPAVMNVLDAYQAQLDLSAFEFFSEAALQKVVAHQQLQRPFEQATNFYALIEIEQVTGAELDTAMGLFEQCMEQGWVRDGVVSQSVGQARDLWRLREDISETLSHWTPYKNDLSVQVSRVPAFLGAVETLVVDAYPDFEIIWYGHIGDGNVHLNILKPEELDVVEFQRQCGEVSKGVFEIVRQFGGSVSAEHGVGLLKKDYLGYSRSAEEISLMRGVKGVFDPLGIMNPGKIFDL